MEKLQPMDINYMSEQLENFLPIVKGMSCEASDKVSSQLFIEAYWKLLKAWEIEIECQLGENFDPSILKL